MVSGSIYICGGGVNMRMSTCYNRVRIMSGSSYSGTMFRGFLYSASVISVIIRGSNSVSVVVSTSSNYISVSVRRSRSSQSTAVFGGFVDVTSGSIMLACSDYIVVVVYVTRFNYSGGGVGGRNVFGVFVFFNNVVVVNSSSGFRFF